MSNCMNTSNFIGSILNTTPTLLFLVYSKQFLTHCVSIKSWSNEALIILSNSLSCNFVGKKVFFEELRLNENLEFIIVFDVYETSFITQFGR